MAETSEHDRSCERRDSPRVMRFQALPVGRTVAGRRAVPSIAVISHEFSLTALSQWSRLQSSSHVVQQWVWWLATSP